MVLDSFTEPEVMTNPEPAANDISLNTEIPTIEEVIKAIKILKPGKSPGIDSIHAEMLKEDLDTSSKINS